ncbi:unnamed protein product, partial [Effrenium voratum]
KPSLVRECCFQFCFSVSSMKRPRDETVSFFPLATPLTGRFLLYGNICLDCAFKVPSYPKEDSAQRATGYSKKLGGNSANSCTVLAQLLGRGRVSTLSIIPDRGNPDAAFAVSTLEGYGVDTSQLQEIPGAGLPTSFVLLSEDSGARTIISHRSGLKEMDPSHLAQVLRANDFCWCHLECRQLGVADMAQLSRELRPKAVLSVEIEKPSMDLQAVLPMLSRCDVVFFSSDYIKAHAPTAGEADGDDWQKHSALRCLQTWAAACNAQAALWICAWGSLGAFAYDTAAKQSFFQAAEKARAVETVAAGDTFIAAAIYALASGASASEALRCACAVAGQKVAQEGLQDLALAVPKDMPWKA